jgi:hypothetical protein
MIEKSKCMLSKVMHHSEISLADKNLAIIFTQSCIHAVAGNFFPDNNYNELFLNEDKAS